LWFTLIKNEFMPIVSVNLSVKSTEEVYLILSEIPNAKFEFHVFAQSANRISQVFDPNSQDGRRIAEAFGKPLYIEAVKLWITYSFNPMVK
jgi:hypothetical protein